MTEPNRRENLRAEVRRGEESLAAARVLLAASMYADAVSRAYYAAYHLARALVVTVGHEPRTHGGLDRVLQRDLVRSGRFDPDVARLLSRLMQYRQSADYAPEYTFTATHAEEEVASAERFVTEAKAVLTAEGWLDR